MTEDEAARSWSWMLATKHFDPVIGVDTHLVLIAGAPTPMPVPFVGVVFDPFDYLPVVGSKVLINGRKRANAGTAVMAMPCHLPLPYVKPPSSDGELFMGSSTVLCEGEPMGYAGLSVLTCQDVGMPAPVRASKSRTPKSLYLPTSFAMPIPGGPMVMIGGAPTISLAGMAGRAALGPLQKRLGKALGKCGKLAAGTLAHLTDRPRRALSRHLNEIADKVFKQLGLSLTGSARNRVRRGICKVTGHPVDIATGKVFTDFVDLVLAGPLPLALERVWYSTSTYDGPFGHGWHLPFDMAIAEDDEVLGVRLGDGRVALFPALKIGQAHFNLDERLTLERHALGYVLTSATDGLTYAFAGVAQAETLPLVHMEDRNGFRIRFRRDPRGRLREIVDSGERVWGFAYDTLGRVSAIAGPHPREADKRVVYVRYVYDRDGNLCEVRDALDVPQRFAYERHLLVRETNRNGLSFYFEYDGKDEQARCVRTWGDGGIYDHKLSYDAADKVTVVENSLGYKTRHRHDGAMVFQTIDALGQRRTTKYGPGYLVLEETDELKQTTLHQYDDRGNLTRRIAPDGSVLTLAYEHDLPVLAVDVNGGTWSWKRDECGRVLSQTNPLGQTTHYEYSGRFLVGVVDAAGTKTAFGYSLTGELDAVSAPDAGLTRFAYDRLGRLLASMDPKGNVQERELGLLGRVVRVQEPDGNVRTLAYDGEGNVVRAKDAHHDVRFTYRGMNRLASRHEAGTTVHFEYDTEEQLTGIVNEHGAVYRFVYGPNGEVVEEHGFDGLMRRYTRDAAGRVIRVDRPGGRHSAYVHDPAGRVNAVEHSDGSRESYTYRLDGALLVAVNDKSGVEFERDALGRVVKEIQGEHWVENEYDARGQRVRMRSSLGADVAIERNAAGDVMKLGEQRGFEARFTRDALGLELERTLPGGFKSRWRRDMVGRPLEHQVEQNGSFLRGVRYGWEPNDRLRTLEVWRDTIHFHHDALGNLAWARYPDGEFELRLPDAVGNLFRSDHQNDRTYGPAGQLLSAHDRRGVTHYAYDVEGNLIEKREPDGRVWRYTWNAAGMLASAQRPDGSVVAFRYDPLGRRIQKTYRGQTTHWVWDGNVPLHEWVEGKLLPLAEAGGVPFFTDDATVHKREAELEAHLAQGPPRRGSRNEPITWLFEPESFAPMARLQGKEQQAIVCDHLGTPVLMVEGAARGASGWSGQLGVYGDLRKFSGPRWAVPFRWPGQYEDAETGLYYNRFRYYDAEAGQYASQDPIGLAGGPAPYAYVHDALTWTDPLGLKPCGPKVIVVGEGMVRVKHAVKDLQMQGVDAKWYQAWGKNFPKGRNMTPGEMHASLARNKRWLKQKMKDGYEIRDIGSQPGRTNPSPFYAMEKQLLSDAKYPVTPLPGY